MDDRHHLLICTVGGTPEPIIATIRHWKPARVQFIASEGTRKDAGAVAEVPDLLQPGSWDMMVLADAQDFSDCVRRMRSLDEQVTAWRQKGPAYDVIADFTGGTKCMSAALSLVSRRWPCASSIRARGSVIVVEPQALIRRFRLLARGFRSRKQPLAMASLFGPALTARYLLGALWVADLEKRGSRLIGATAVAVRGADPSLAMDCDDPADFEYARAHA